MTIVGSSWQGKDQKVQNKTMRVPVAIDGSGSIPITRLFILFSSIYAISTQGQIFKELDLFLDLSKQKI
jgi:hypothetical protein